MRKEVITNKQGTILMIMFIAGSSLIVGAGFDAKIDQWLSLLIAIVVAIPVLLVYARLLTMYPGKNLFEILEEIFGSVIGKIISAFYIFYFIHLGALVLKNFSAFINIIGLKETPEVLSVIIMGVLCIWVVKEGVEVLGRWSQFIFPIIVLLVLFLVTLSFQKIDFNNLKPFMYDGFYPIFKGAFNAFSFPFAETVAFLMVLNHLKEAKSANKVFTIGLLLGGVLILIVSIRNLLVLGVEYESSTYFATYEAASLIKVGDFLQRLEAFVSVMFLFTGFVKISICLLAASKGIEKLFNLSDYRKIVAPIGLLLMITSCFLYEDFLSSVDWAFNIYCYYALPFQVILPIIILVTAEVKIRILKKNNIQQLPQKS